MNISHSFSVDVACAVGERRAVILNNFGHWHLKNGADGKHVYDGHVWSYNSIRGYTKVWPYLSEKEVRTAFEGLIKEGYLVTGNYNEWKTDQTKWYALTEKSCTLLGIEFEPVAHLPKRATGIDQTGNWNCPTGQTDMPKRANGFAPEGRPIPIEKPIEKPIQQQPEIADAVVVAADFDFDFLKTKINTVRGEVLKGPILKEQTCMNLRIRPDHFDKLVNAFFDEQIGLAQAGEPIRPIGLRKHLSNWIKVQIKIGTDSTYHESFSPVAPPAENRYPDGRYNGHRPGGSLPFKPSNQVFNELT